MKRLLYIIIPILLLLFFADCAQAGIIIRPVLNTGLVGYWDFQEGAGDIAYDRSGYNNNGTWAGTGTSHWTDGKIGEAGNFNGSDDYVLVGNPTELQLTTTGTIAAWIYKKDNDRNHIVGKNKWDTDVNGYTFEAGPSGQLIADVSSADATDQITGLTVLSTERWYFAVFTWDGSFLKLYLNGQSDAVPVAQTQTAKSDVWDLQIGNSPSYPAYLNGKLDEVRIYNRALSESEVERLYKLSAPKIYSAPKNGLVGYWSFNEGTGTKVGDMSGNGNHGTFQAGMTQGDWVEGKFGKALEFDGGTNDYVDFGNPISLQLTSRGSVSLWLKYSTLSNHGGVVSKNDWCSDVYGYNIGIGAGDQKIGGEIANATTDNSIVSSKRYDDNQWHHVVFTWDGSYLRLYIDNASAATPKPQTINAVSNVYNLRFGKISGCSGYYYKGLLDEVYIYNRDLDASEITALYKSGLKKISASQNNQLTDGLVGYWSFNGPDIDGDTAYDRSGNSYHGTLKNNPSLIDGKVGQALYLKEKTTGNEEYVLLPENMPALTDFTISGWMKTSFPLPNQTLWGKDDNNRLMLREDSEYLVLNGNLRPYITTASNKDVWVHIVITRKGTTASYYRNGVYVCSWDVGADQINFASSYLGSDTGEYSSNELRGFLDEVRLYNRALEPWEIKRLYNLGR